MHGSGVALRIGHSRTVSRHEFGLLLHAPVCAVALTLASLATTCCVWPAGEQEGAGGLWQYHQEHRCSVLSSQLPAASELVWQSGWVG